MLPVPARDASFYRDRAVEDVRNGKGSLHYLPQPRNPTRLGLDSDHSWRPMTTRATVFIDSNVLLHYRFFDELDWTTLIKADEVVLTICAPVIRELDRKKWSGHSSRVRDRAVRVMRRIGALISDNQRVSLSERMSLWLPSREPSIDYGTHSLDKTVVDDVILACIVEGYGCENSEPVLVSADLGLRLKANNLSLKTVVPPDDWRLPLETDETEKQLKATQTELNALKAAAPRLRLVFGNGNSFVEYDVQPRPAWSEEEIAKRLEEIKDNDSPMEIAELTHEFLAILATYNSVLRKYYREYEHYLRSRPTVFEPRDRTLSLKLRLENIGQRSRLRTWTLF